MSDIDPQRAADEALRKLRAAGFDVSVAHRFGTPCVAISFPEGALLVSLTGAQILEWSHLDCNPLWITEEALHTPGAPIRGGIPVCWPWFGPPHPPFTGPTHGLARRRVWRLVSAAQQEDGVALHFRLNVVVDEYALRADYRITAGRELALQLATTNLGDTPCPVTPAFHPYFAATLPCLRVSLAESVQPLDRLTGKYLAATSHVRASGEEMEMQWAPWQNVTLESGRAAKIVISSSDAAHSVLWNPGPGKSRRLADLAPGAWEDFVCVEPGQLDPASQILAPGATSTLSVRISAG